MKIAKGFNMPKTKIEEINRNIYDIKNKDEYSYNWLNI